MRFILNFFFYGILFYAIYLFFPDAFTTLVSWANHVWTFGKEIVMDIWNQIQHYLSSTPHKS